MVKTWLENERILSDDYAVFYSRPSNSGQQVSGFGDYLPRRLVYECVEKQCGH